MLSQSKIVTVNKYHQEILQSIDKYTLVDAYFGGSNLTAEYLNDYSSDGINEFIGEFIDEHWNKPHGGVFLLYKLSPYLGAFILSIHLYNKLITCCYTTYGN